MQRLEGLRPFCFPGHDYNYFLFAPENLKIYFCACRWELPFCNSKNLHQIKPMSLRMRIQACRWKRLDNVLNQSLLQDNLGTFIKLEWIDAKNVQIFLQKVYGLNIEILEKSLLSEVSIVFSWLKKWGFWQLPNVWEHHNSNKWHDITFFQRNKIGELVIATLQQTH